MSTVIIQGNETTVEAVIDIAYVPSRGHHAGGAEMITTTLTRIREHQPCADGWTKLLKHLGKTQDDDEPLTFATILESNGLDDALWCCRAEPEYAREWRLYAVWCARRVQHLMTDSRSLAALDVAERYANGKATAAELAAARAAGDAAVWDATWAAARDATRDATRDVVWDAARAAARDATRDVVWAAARAAARDATRDVVWDAARAAAEAAARAAGDATRDVVWDAARDAAWAVARDAAWAAQAAEFLRVVTETEVQS